MNGDAALRIIEANHRAALAQYDVNSQLAIEATKAANKAGADAIKAITLLNGGAAVAMMAFIGHLASSAGQQRAVISLRSALALFVVGTLLAVCAAGVTYIGQGCVSTALGHEFKKLYEADAVAKARAARKETQWRRLFRIVNSVAALICFVVACWRAYDTFEDMGSEGCSGIALLSELIVES